MSIINARPFEWKEKCGRDDGLDVGGAWDEKTGDQAMMKSADQDSGLGGDVAGKRPGAWAPCAGSGAAGAPRVNPRPAAVA